MLQGRTRKQRLGREGPYVPGRGSWSFHFYLAGLELWAKRLHFGKAPEWCATLAALTKAHH